MKKPFLGLMLCCFALHSQITVTTITSPFKGSGGLSLDQHGNLYIGDFGDFLSAGNPGGATTNVWKLDKQGNMTVVASGFAGASGNAFDSKGNFYQADIRASTIYAVDTAGNKTVYATAGINAPVGLVFDDHDNLFVCNCGGNTIQKVDTNGVSTVFASGSLFNCPNGITRDHKGNFYVSNFNGANNVIKITPSGVSSVFASINGNNNGHLEYFASDSTFYVCSHGSSAIYILDYSGAVLDNIGTFQRGNDDGGQYVASFSRPNGIAISPSGDSIYINSSVPLINIPNNPLNPSLIRLISGVKTLGINREHKTSMEVYPNPNCGWLKLELPYGLSCTEMEIRIYDMNGKEVMGRSDLCYTINGTSLNLDIHELQEGSYSLILEAADESYSSLFVKH